MTASVDELVHRAGPLALVIALLPPIATGSSIAADAVQETPSSSRPAPAPSAPQPDRLRRGPMPQENADREAFLRAANVVDTRAISEGITLPDRLELELDGVHRSAAFKSVEIEFEGDIRVGRETQSNLRDSWKFEVAAYELDKLLGLGMVPVTVVRTIGEREGALIDWVEDVLPQYGVSAAGFDMASWENEVARVWLFDYLAYNIDRTPENLLITPGFEVKLIDHSRAFQRFLVPMRPLFRFPRGVIQRLRQLVDEDLQEALGTYLTDEEMDALLERKRRVLERVDALLSSRPEAEVLF